MGFQGLASPEQNAEEDTLDQGPAQVDAEVGAGEHAVVVPRSTAQHSASARRVTQGVGIFLALAVVSMGFRLMSFRPIASGGSGAPGVVAMDEASRNGAGHIGSWINSIKTGVLFPALGGLMVVVGDWVVSSASSLPRI